MHIFISCCPDFIFFLLFHLRTALTNKNLLEDSCTHTQDTYGIKKLVQVTFCILIRKFYGSKEASGYEEKIATHTLIYHPAYTEREEIR
jgi:hypothetical protein